MATSIAFCVALDLESEDRRSAQVSKWKRMSEDETKAKEETAEDTASAIIVSTCQLIPKSLNVISEHMHNLIGSVDPTPTVYSILCGSFAEIYIRPLNPCISDIDFLICSTDSLAFSGDLPVVPTNISGLSDRIFCNKIEPYHEYPGFVRLLLIGVMNYNWKCKKFEFCHARRRNLNAYLHRTFDNPIHFHFITPPKEIIPEQISNGPAIQSTEFVGHDFTKDAVISVWCPQWPREALSWTIRPRNYGWPKIATICEVVQNGCHVVHAQHRSCKDDTQQWRLSFSFAEVILLQSWTRDQQIVYHMLRFFAKRELIQKDCPKEDKVLCTYHLKTLMLWTCEEMPPEWWNSCSVFTICCDLLQKLLAWLKQNRCPNYFIPEANLFHEQWNQKIRDQSEAQLIKFCKSSILCDWFLDNYIQPFIATHFKFKEVTSGREVAPRLMDGIMRVFEHRKASESESLHTMLSFRFKCSHFTCRVIFKCGLTSGLRQCFDIGFSLKHLDAKTYPGWSCLPTIEKVSCFSYYDNVLQLLHAAYAIGCGETSWDSRVFVEFVKAISAKPKVIRSHYHSFPKPDTAESSRFQFLRANDLLKNLTGSNCRSEFRLLSPMAKEFLRRALEYDDSESNGIAVATLAYLAALHFSKSEYQSTIRFCFSILSVQTPQEQKETLNAGCLLFIDDVARIVGLCLLYWKVTGKNVHYINRIFCLDLRLSPEVFAYYLMVLSAERISKHLDFYHDLPYSSFPIDEYFQILIMKKCVAAMKLGSHFNTARQIVYGRTDSLTETNATFLNRLTDKETVIYILLEYALENMSLFQTVFRQDFIIQCNTFDCYRALFLYKCRQYDEMMPLCERILCEPDVQNDLKKYAFANVLLVPPLDSFFDGDVQSLLGFHTLFYYLSPLNDELRWTWTCTPELTFEVFFASAMFFYSAPLSASISNGIHTIRCHYYLGRQFVARYLKARCCIDSNIPYAEAITDFFAQKTTLPFERIIRRFLLRNLYIIRN